MNTIELINYEKYVKELKARNTIEELKEKIHDLEILLREFKNKKELSEIDLKRCLKNLDDNADKLKEISGIKSLFISRKEKLKKNTYKNNIEYYESELKKVESEIVNLEIEIENGSEKLLKLQELLLLKESEYTIKVGNSLKVENDVLVVTDEIERIEVPKDRNKEVIIHVTDFFPKNKTILCNYDGDKRGKVTISYNGINKVVESLSHRHTVHFVQNGVVESTSDGLGVWEQPKYIIIEPFDYHKDEFVDGSPNDLFTYGSVELKGKPILIIRHDEFDNLPKEEMNNYNIIKYNGNYKDCLKNLLHSLGIPRQEIYKDDPGHFNSIFMKCELALGFRNKFLNYIRDNSWDGKEKIIIKKEELFTMYEMTKEEPGSLNFGVFLDYSLGNLLRKISEEIEIDKNFMFFMISMGIYKSDNNYLFKSDDELYYENSDLINKFRQDNDIEYLKQAINLDDIISTYKEYSLWKNEKENKIDVEDYDISNISISELYKFENNDIARKYLDSLGIDLKKYNIIFNTDSCEIKTVLEVKYNYDVLKMYVIDNDQNLVTLAKTIDNKQDLTKEILDFVNICEEVKNKEIIEELTEQNKIR